MIPLFAINLGLVAIGAIWLGLAFGWRAGFGAFFIASAFIDP